VALASSGASSEDTHGGNTIGLRTAVPLDRMQAVGNVVGASVDAGDLLVVLLTGGGLALLGTVLGALITQTFTIRFGRETRREERRLAIKSFQRDTLVTLQDRVIELSDLTSAVRRAQRDEGDEGDEGARDEYRTAAQRVRMLASRVRDEQLRSDVHKLLETYDALLERGMTRGVVRRLEDSRRSIYDRAGELIRTLDRIDEAQ
jgi:hypothetical protein